MPENMVALDCIHVHALDEDIIAISFPPADCRILSHPDHLKSTWKRLRRNAWQIGRDATAIA